MATHTGHVMNLANSIIGVSLLAMPFCFKQCGITLAIVMLIISSIMSRLACHFLVKSSTMCRRRNFEFLAFYTFGPSGKLLVELGVIGFMMGTCVAFFVVMGDLGPAIISKIFNINNTGTLRTSVLIGLGFLVVLPLGLLRNVESLATISTATIGFYILFILKIFIESSSQLFSSDWWYHVNFWQPEGILQCIPIFAMALSCQTQVFEIYDSLPTPTIEKMNSVVCSALNLCTIVYTSVGFLGYIAYCKGNFTGNILLSFAPSLSSEMFKLGFVMSIAVSFPLVIFPCRASLFSLIFKRVPIHHELSQTSSHIPDSRFKCLTIGIVSVALVTGLLIPSIELVLGFVGSTIGVAICVVFPSLSFLYLSNKNTNEQLIAKVTLCMGLIVMIMGTFGNLFAAMDRDLVEPPSVIMGMQKNLPQLKMPPLMEVSTELTKNSNKGILLVNPVVPDTLLSFKPGDSLKIKDKSMDNQRKEPPVPMAPVPKNKEPLVVRPQIQIIETKKVEESKKVPKQRPAEEKKTVEWKENRLVENINKDAIEKEDREIMEIEKQKKTEEDQKQQELLKILKEHSDEQKKLLREQEKILIELKNRENEKKSNEVLKGKPEIEKTVVSENAKPDKLESRIKNDYPKKAESVSKINVVQSMNASVEKLKASSNKTQPVVEIPKNVKAPEKSGGMRNLGASVPLPLAKLHAQPDLNKADKKSKQEILSRDILVVEKSNKTHDREKRDAEEGLDDNRKCEKTEKKSEDNQDTTPNDIPKQDTVLLMKTSGHLSLGLGEEKKQEMTDSKSTNLIPEILNQPLISKKRDLKSVTET